MLRSCPGPRGSPSDEEQSKTWSTRELAGLAGTTVNTIRHDHRLGLLDEPERRANGYKQYGVPDLVRLLRIRRLAELGVSLSQIAEVGAGAAAEAVARTMTAIIVNNAIVAAAVLPRN